jgi:hypothetical protein
MMLFIWYLCNTPVTQRLVCSRSTGLLGLVSIDIPKFLSSLSVPLSEGVPITPGVNLWLSNVGFDMPLTIWSQGYRRQVTCALYHVANLLKAMFYHAQLSALKIPCEWERFRTVVRTLQFFGHIMFVMDRVVLRVQLFANRIEAMQRMQDLHSERYEFLYLQSDLDITYSTIEWFIIGTGSSNCTPSSSLRKRYWPAINIGSMSLQQMIHVPSNRSSHVL